MPAVTVHYLSGDVLRLESCPTVGSLMAQVALLNQRFAAEVLVVCLDTGKDLTKPHTDAPPSTASVVFKQAVDRPTEGDLYLTLFLHGEREDTATCGRAIEVLRKHYPEVCVDDILLRAIKTCSAKDQNKILPTLLRAGISGNAALRASAVMGNKGAAVKKLLAARMCPNTRFADGSTALIHAASFGRKYVVGALLSGRADANLFNKKGETAIAATCREAAYYSEGRWKKCEAVVEVLLHHGADVNLSQENANTALTLASHFGRKGLVEMLLGHAAEVNKAAGEMRETALLQASEKGHGDVVEMLLARSAQVDFAAKGGETALMRASEKRRKGIVQILLAHGAQVNNASQHGRTALTYACRTGSADVVETLLSHGAQVNVDALERALSLGHAKVARALLACDPHVDSVATSGVTPLMAASDYEKKDIVEKIIALGAQVNFVAQSGETALMRAIRAGCEVVMKILLAHGAQVSRKALKLGIVGGRVHVVKVLLAHDPEVDRETTSDWTPLIVASEKGHKDLVELFVARGAQVDFTTKNGQTALMHASRAGRKDIVKLLLTHGAHVNCAAKDGFTALMQACTGRWDDVVDTLLSHGVQVSREALKLAISHGNTNIVKALLAHNPEVDLETTPDWTPLIVASECGHKDLVELFLGYGADVNQANSSGETALMAASTHGDSNVVNLLLTHGTIVNSTDQNGSTALIMASFHGHDKIAAALLSHGAHVNHADGQGTALIAAAKNGHAKVVKRLLSRGAELNPEDQDGATALEVLRKHYGSERVEKMLLSRSKRRRRGKSCASTSNRQDKGQSNILEGKRDTKSASTETSLNTFPGLNTIASKKVKKNTGKKASSITTGGAKGQTNAGKMDGAAGCNDRNCFLEKDESKEADHSSAAKEEAQESVERRGISSHRSYRSEASEKDAPKDEGCQGSSSGAKGGKDDKKKVSLTTSATKKVKKNAVKKVNASISGSTKSKRNVCNTSGAASCIEGNDLLEKDESKDADHSGTAEEKGRESNDGSGILSQRNYRSEASEKNAQKDTSCQDSSDSAKAKANDKKKVSSTTSATKKVKKYAVKNVNASISRSTKSERNVCNTSGAASCIEGNDLLEKDESKDADYSSTAEEKGQESDEGSGRSSHRSRGHRLSEKGRAKKRGPLRHFKQ